MADHIPFYKSIPYRNITLDLTMPPFPQENGSEWSISNRTMNDYDLFVCEQGSALFTMGSVTYRLKAGMGLLVPPECLISARKTSVEPVRMVAQHFMLYLFHRTDFFSHIKYEPLITFPRKDLIFTLTEEIRRAMETGTEKWTTLDTSPAFMLILKEFIEESYSTRNVREERKSHMVLEMMEAVEREYRNPLLLEKLMENSPTDTAIRPIFSGSTPGGRSNPLS